MKFIILSLLLTCSSILAFSQNVKINFKGEIRPYKFKIEKTEVKNGETNITIDEKYSLSFPGGEILTAEKFDIKIGNIQDRSKTDLIFRDIILKNII